MRVQLVRNATLLLDSSHGRILVDPMLRAAGTSPPIENSFVKLISLARGQPGAQALERHDASDLD